MSNNNLNIIVNKNKRKAIPIETKYEIIQKHLQGVEPKHLAKEYDLASSTLSTIFANKEKITDQ